MLTNDKNNRNTIIKLHMFCKVDFLFSLFSTKNDFKYFKLDKNIHKK